MLPVDEFQNPQELYIDYVYLKVFYLYFYYSKKTLVLSIQMYEQYSLFPNRAYFHLLSIACSRNYFYNVIILKFVFCTKSLFGSRIYRIQETFSYVGMYCNC